MEIGTAVGRLNLIVLGIPKAFTTVSLVPPNVPQPIDFRVEMVVAIAVASPPSTTNATVRAGTELASVAAESFSSYVTSVTRS